jgi:NitT/TauT family transport system permease protein
VSAPARQGRLLQPRYWLPVLSLAVVLTAWELVGRSVDPLLFAPPSRVGASFVELTRSGELLDAVVVTVNTLLVGYGLAIVVGIPVGVLLAQSPTVGAVVQPYFYGIFSTPRVVIVPLIIVWFGVGYGGRLLLVFLWSMIAIATSTADGVRNARPDLVEVARSFGVRRSQIVRHVLLPGSVPFVVAGLRIGAERAVVGVVIGEMFLQLTGIGGLIQTNAQNFEAPAVLCAVVTIAVIGAGLLAVLDVLERRVSRWKQRPD